MSTNFHNLAAWSEEPKGDLQIKEAPIPTLKDDEILIEVGNQLNLLPTLPEIPIFVAYADAAMFARTTPLRSNHSMPRFVVKHTSSSTTRSFSAQRVLGRLSPWVPMFRAHLLLVIGLFLIRLCIRSGRQGMVVGRSMWLGRLG